MFGNAKGQTIFLRGRLPFAHHVAMRPHLHGIPAMHLGIPQKEIVVMRAHADKIFRAGLFVELHQFFRLPFLGFPEWNDVLPSIRGRMTEPRKVILVIRTWSFVLAGLAIDLIGDIHLARIPVTLLGHSLRSPVRPDAELGFPEPLRTGIIGQRFHRAGVRTGRDGKVQGFGAKAARTGPTTTAGLLVSFSVYWFITQNQHRHTQGKWKNASKSCVHFFDYLTDVKMTTLRAGRLTCRPAANSASVNISLGCGNPSLSVSLSLEK